jgi:nitrogen regulatory protein PII
LATSWGSLGAKDNRDHGKLEVAVPADLTQRVAETICDAARTGNIGDGKIVVLALDAAQRVRTGETGESAL